MSTPDYIELDRTFHELSRYAIESDDSDLSKAIFDSDELTWEQLQEEYRVVILSEAGSGKTEEIRHAAERLRSLGNHAFFLRLENIPAHFENAFDVGTLSEFEDWLLSGREGWLLLDSVDEARLRHPQDFELAIKMLGDRAELALDRSHIFLTSRISAWRPKTDLELCKRFLPYAPIARVPGEETEAPRLGVDQADDGDLPERDASISSDTQAGNQSPTAPFRIVTLDDLDPERVELFAKRSGIDDVSSFTKAIDKADAWSFTTRPQDLYDLIAFWADEGRIGGRLAIMQNSVSRRLRERDQNRDVSRPLASDRVEAGARLLAAATTLGKNPSIRVPDGAEGLNGIHVEEILPGWTARERAAILDRPIFDAPAYGSVRFHHRTVREYLAADWLRVLLQHTASRRAIEGLFFKEQYGVPIIVPTMRPVLPWLAIFDARIRERVRNLAPEVLFESGDPAQLPLETRREVLREVIKEIAHNYTPRSPTHLSAAQRFAHVDLTEDIRKLLQEFSESSEAVSFLLKMIWQGQIKGALPETRLQAMTSGGNTYRRVAAIRALHEIGSEQDRRDLRAAILADPAPIRREWLAEILHELGQSAEEVEWLLAALARVEPLKRYSVDHLPKAVKKYVDEASTETLSRLILEIADLLAREPYIEAEFVRVSDAFKWLLPPAAAILERLIQIRGLVILQPEVLKVFHAIGASRHYGADIGYMKTNLSELVPTWPDLNRELFWSEVEFARKEMKRSDSISSPWQVSILGSFWKFGREDFDYLCDQIERRNFIDDKLMLLSLAFQSYVLAGRPRPAYDQLKAAAFKEREINQRFLTLVNPPPRSLINSQEARWRRQAKTRERAERTNKRKSVEYIRKNVETVRDPKFPNPNDVSSTQWYLYHQTGDNAERSGKWTTGEWKVLAPTFGEEVAQAYRNGAILHWRRATPTVRSEGAVANQTSASVIFGLTGLAIEAKETPYWTSGLSKSDAIRACRYASHELNGFPDWLPALFQAFPSEVTDFLMQEVTFEVREEPEEGMHYIIDDLSWGAAWSWKHLGPHIYRLLGEVEPRRGDTLDKLLQMVLGSDIKSEDIAVLSEKKALATPPSPHAAHWFAAWTEVSPNQAITAFESYLANLEESETRTTAAMTFITRLLGERRSDFNVARDGFRTPSELKRLYILMHRHIRRDDDINRANGGVYSPTLRDNAQDARNAILNVLEAIPGKESYFAMKELADFEKDESANSWISYRALRRAEQDGDLAPWSANQVREFNDSQERTPKSHRELAELVSSKLLDLKDDLEDGDSSVASILRGVTEETEMRIFIGRDLRDKAAGRYTVPQGEELADVKRPDISICGAGIDAPLPVEVKLVDKLTGPELFERMWNQLSNNYVEDGRSLHRIFVLVHQGASKGQWDSPSNAHLDFDGLISALREEWRRLAPEFPSVNDFFIIGIDLTAGTK